MGLPGLAIDADIAGTWRGILQEKGMTVSVDENEQTKQEALQRKHEAESGSRRITEVPWLVCDGKAELPILEAKFRDRPETFLIFMRFDTTDERQLFSRVQEILIAAGAMKK